MVELRAKVALTGDYGHVKPQQIFRTTPDVARRLLARGAVDKLGEDGEQGVVQTGADFITRKDEGGGVVDWSKVDWDSVALAEALEQTQQQGQAQAQQQGQQQGQEEEEGEEAEEAEEVEGEGGDVGEEEEDEEQSAKGQAGQVVDRKSIAGYENKMITPRENKATGKKKTKGR